MFKILDKLTAHWSKRMTETSGMYIFIMLGQMLVFVLTGLGLSYFLASYLSKTSYFSAFSQPNIFLCTFGLFALLTSGICFAHIIHINKAQSKAEERLKNRSLADYETKYKSYVDIVESLLQKEGYEKDHFAKDWLKEFDRHLTNLARLCCRKYEREFTDFEVAACLMYALTNFLASKNIFAICTDFAFDCVKEILILPLVYNCNWLDGDELVLEVQSTHDPIDFSMIAPEHLPFVYSLLECYLSQDETYKQFLELADFLKVLGMMYCDNTHCEE